MAAGRPDMRAEVVIVGGGIAGLWTLDTLVRAGYDAVLFEQRALGCEQTGWSQGILHSGLKYALDGRRRKSSQGIGDAPSVWARCLDGTAHPDLSSASVVSGRHLLWTPRGAALGKLTAAAASLAMRTQPRAVPRGERPPLLEHAESVQEVAELVVDPLTVAGAILRTHSGRIVRSGVRIDRAGDTEIALVVTDKNAAERTVHARYAVLTAGGGAAQLREQAGLSSDAMQIRPLRMVLARGGALEPLWAHCVQAGTTLLTITSGRDADGRVVWQIGGQVAEDGAAHTPAETIARTARELSRTLPLLDQAGIEWSTYEAPRAEGRTTLRTRPGREVVRREGAIVTAWPTKLVLAPALAERVRSELDEPCGSPGKDGRWDAFEPCGVAAPVWESGLEWSCAPSADRGAADQV